MTSQLDSNMRDINMLSDHQRLGTLQGLEDMDLSYKWCEWSVN